jgi:hypothetical protein
MILLLCFSLKNLEAGDWEAGVCLDFFLSLILLIALIFENDKSFSVYGRWFV